MTMSTITARPIRVNTDVRDAAPNASFFLIRWVGVHEPIRTLTAAKGPDFAAQGTPGATPTFPGFYGTEILTQRIVDSTKG
ncbi:hypothetical protein GCM10010532_006450 [Dactylosporangium siamense]|uniref:Uncharacterized protein n=1 Tax=Dactylosporangium siamense TaxID=685454 RepID=A0A919UEK7_9ACTN|nr:hypothetical protein Dsi01nite_107480 [Dactylosporangium siamense]